MAYQIAVDVGGTFTDGVLLDESTDTIWVAKTLTTSSDPGEGIACVINMLLMQKPPTSHKDCGEVGRVVHGTTLITNTLLQRKGANIALVVTQGAEDALDIRREVRYDTYDLAATFPEPLVPPEARFTLDERIGSTGGIRRPLRSHEVERLALQLAREDFAAVAICFLHAYANSKHEQQAAEILRRISPNRCYALSSEVANEVGEYERMSTVVANAYVQPIVESYMRLLSNRLTSLGIDGRLDIMVSHGGFTEAELAARFPIRLLESGPAGGVLSAINCGAVEGTSRILAFDMGGTTAKSCVSIDGAPAITHVFEFARVRRFKRGSGLPAVSPSIDLIEIGAGGGSIARKSALGLLQVGPESAGSQPGPVCYGLGGADPTVTDADLVLGYVDAGNFLGGKMRLDSARAREALGRLGKELGLSVEETAWGIHDIVNGNMAAAARMHIAEQGYDARTFTMVATGGAGPGHAVDVARRLRIPRVLCPIASGVGSCLGFLAAPARADRSWSKVESIKNFDPREFTARIDQARQAIAEDLARANVPPGEVRWRTSAEMRYLGQGSSIEIDLSHARTIIAAQLLAEFETEYRRLYGRTVPGGVPELVTWRITGQSRREQRQYGFPQRPNCNLTDRAVGERRIYVASEQRMLAVPVYDRYRTAIGTSVNGPAVIVEPESTLVIAHPALVKVLETGTIEVNLEHAE